MTTWTDPATYTSSQILTAANLNTYLRDNMLWIKSPSFSVQAVSTTTTTSTSFVAVTGVSRTLTGFGGCMMIWFTGAADNSNVGIISNFDFAIDGTRQGDTTNGLNMMQQPVAAYRVPIGMYIITASPVAAGSHTYTLQWKTGANTLTLETAGQFGVLEVP